MSTFDISPDAPTLLRFEALNMQVKLERTSETTARISWNIPTPAAGCTSDNQAYCGIILTADTTPIDQSKLPTDGVMYTSDPTVNKNLFAGDKIGTSLVVGAFFQDRTSTFLDITGLLPNTPLYVTGFPVDCQLRYFYEGVSAYSLNAGDAPGTAATSSTQTVVFTQPDGTAGVKPNDYTGLVPGVTYTYNVSIGAGGLASQPQVPLPPSACVTKPTLFNFTIKGEDALTYQDLIDEINYQFGQATGCPASPQPPNAGTFYWNAVAQKLYLFDGYLLLPLPVFVQPIAPNLITIGTYWYNPVTKILYRWDGVAWIAQTVIIYATDPTQPICDQSIWFDGVSVHLWNGITWCDTTLYTSVIDPSLQQPAPCGSYWYKTSTKQMYKWDDALEIWITTIAIQANMDPNALPIGYYWFNSTNNTLYQWSGVTWVAQVNVRIQETVPTMPGPGTFWYNPLTSVLEQWDGTMWVVITDVTTFSSNPFNRTSCDLWWNTATDILYVWDIINNVWKAVVAFYQQNTDPTIPPIITDGSYWLNPTTLVIYTWVNGCWINTQYISFPTDPTQMINGTVWFNGTNWFYWNGLAWILFVPTISETDPALITAGAYWFNTTNNTLNLWNGALWINLLYVTTPPTPVKGDCWFNSATGQVMTWDGTQWIATKGVATVELDCNGNMLFTDTMTGSTSYIAVDGRTLQPSLQFGYAVWVITSAGLGTLWPSLASLPTFTNPQPGGDAISATPMYRELGIGTDGSMDERLALATEIRFQLGYPVIDVELTKEQLDYFITKAIDEFRQRASIAYRRGFFFMQIAPEVQQYVLSSKAAGYNKIVQIMGVYRMTSAFVSSAHGAGVYGQIVIQHLYNMGTFDLLSYHLMAEYTELMEMLFAARVTFTWNEQTRVLHLLQRYPFAERMVLIEASVERTEQDLLSDRWIFPWIRRYALAQSRIALAEIRGKYSTLPGAGGSVSLNASDLRAAGVEEISLCLADLENYVADMPEEFGMASQFILG